MLGLLAHFNKVITGNKQASQQFPECGHVSTAIYLSVCTDERIFQKVMLVKPQATEGRGQEARSMATP